MSSQCPLCDREYENTFSLSQHHLIPKCRDKKGQKVAICCDCHHQIHALFTEKELEKKYNTVEELKNYSAMKTFIKWISKRPVLASKIKVRRANRRKKK